MESGLRFKFHKREKDMSSLGGDVLFHAQLFSPESQGTLQTEVLDGMNKGGVFVKH